MPGSVPIASFLTKNKKINITLTFWIILNVPAEIKIKYKLLIIHLGNQIVIKNILSKI